MFKKCFVLMTPLLSYTTCFLKLFTGTIVQITYITIFQKHTNWSKYFHTTHFFIYKMFVYCYKVSWVSIPFQFPHFVLYITNYIGDEASQYGWLLKSKTYDLMFNFLRWNKRLLCCKKENDEFNWWPKIERIRPCIQVLGSNSWI